jgi:hypothetical protein
MCISNLKTNTKQIAEEDIPVLKVIKVDDKKKLRSPIFDNEIWQVGDEKTVNLKIICDGFEYPRKLYRSTEGLYSFHKDSDPKYCALVFSYTSNKLEVYEAIIPKGAEYINEGSRFCSNKLKLIKKVC